MKKVIVLGLFAASLSSAAFAADSHSRYAGSLANIKDTLVIRDSAAVEDLVKYTDAKTAAAIRKSFKEDGKLTAAEIKSSGISEHHFYTGYLASSTSQSQYDARLKEMSGGQDLNDKFVSNRDLKAHGSMIMNQVDTKVNTLGSVVQKNNVAQTERSDKLAAGLQQLGDHVANQTAPLPPVEGAPAYDDSAVKESIQSNSNNIQAMGDAFEQRVDNVNGYLEQMGNAIKNNSNSGLNDRLDNLEGAFAAQAAHTTQEIARLDGRIDDLEKKTDKLKAGVAGAIAIGSLTQYTGSGTHHIAVGIGGYEGASALAGGYTYAISAQTTVRATVAYDSEGDFGFGASVGHSW